MKELEIILSSLNAYTAWVRDIASWIDESRLADVWPTLDISPELRGARDLLAELSASDRERAGRMVLRQLNVSLVEITALADISCQRLLRVPSKNFHKILYARALYGRRLEVRKLIGSADLKMLGTISGISVVQIRRLMNGAWLHESTGPVARIPLAHTPPRQLAHEGLSQLRTINVLRDILSVVALSLPPSEDSDSFVTSSCERDSLTFLQSFDVWHPELV